MTTGFSILAIVLFIVLLTFAVLKARKANPQQSSADMHPDTFKKPDIEQVDNNKGHKPPANVP